MSPPQPATFASLGAPLMCHRYSFGSVVEIVLFMVLLSKDQIRVVQAAILGSVLATMLLCLGACFFVGGTRWEMQEFNDAISEAGSGLLLTA